MSFATARPLVPSRLVFLYVLLVELLAGPVLLIRV